MTERVTFIPVAKESSRIVFYRCEVCGATIVNTTDEGDSMDLHAAWHNRVDFKAAFGWGGRV